MKFGERLRELRNDKDLTQPELAEAMGIEQSYLSKLENDKSLPSNDVLNRILDVFDIEVGDLVNDLDQGARNQLRQIPDVGDHFDRQKQQLIGNRRRWLLASALLPISCCFWRSKWSPTSGEVKARGFPLGPGEFNSNLHTEAGYMTATDSVCQLSESTCCKPGWVHTCQYRHERSLPASLYRLR